MPILRYGFFVVGWMHVSLSASMRSHTYPAREVNRLSAICTLHVDPVSHQFLPLGHRPSSRPA